MSYNYKDGYIYIIRKDGGQKHSLFRFKQTHSTLRKLNLCDLKGIKNYHVVTAMDIHESKKLLWLEVINLTILGKIALFMNIVMRILKMSVKSSQKVGAWTRRSRRAVSYKYHEPGIVHLSGLRSQNL